MIVVGHVNDVVLYRDLTRRGVSEYLIAPVAVLDFVRAVSDLFASAGAEPVGRTIAVVGAKGGVGASTVAHNLGWAIADKLRPRPWWSTSTSLSARPALDFNQDPPQSVAEAIFAPDRLDANLVDRLLSKCSDQLSLLAAPAMLDRTTDLSETALDGLIDILRASIPAIVLDVPHAWCAWTRAHADRRRPARHRRRAGARLAAQRQEPVSTRCDKAGPNDRAPKVVLNLTGVAEAARDRRVRVRQGDRHRR